MDLASTCERYAEVGEKALTAKQAEMEKKACEEVEMFLRDCKFKNDITLAGKNILNALLQHRAGGPAVGKLAGGSGALPKDVARWIRENDCHPVIWHTVNEEYQFASELHAREASKILNSPPQSSP